ncbi:hypothetical protein QQM79_11490 [Marinobacteraceae bacterium S3BR75-40.1]
MAKKLLIVAWFVLVEAQVALATPVSYGFSGQFTELTDSRTFPDWEGFQEWYPGQNDSFSGLLVWDKDAIKDSDDVDAYPCSAYLCGGVTELSLVFGETNINIYGISKANPVSVRSEGKTMKILSTIGMAQPVASHPSGLFLIDNFPCNFVFDDELPDLRSIEELPQDGFLSGSLEFTDSQQFDRARGDITSFYKVDEPGSLILTLLGFVFLLGSSFDVNNIRISLLAFRFKKAT